MPFASRALLVGLVAPATLARSTDGTKRSWDVKGTVAGDDPIVRRTYSDVIVVRAPLLGQDH